MPLYWTLKGVPELSHLPGQESGRVWRRVGYKTLRHWQAWLGLVAGGACAWLGSYIGGSFGHSIVGGFVGGSIGGFIFSQVSIHVARLHYRDVLLGDERS